jgi:hypothetical protein
MKWYSIFKHSKNWQFIIDHDHKTNFYTVFVYEDYLEGFTHDLESEFCERHQRDYEQDDLEMAKRCAFNQFGVPYDSWLEAPSADNKIERK